MLCGKNLFVAVAVLSSATGGAAEKARRFVLADESRPRIHYWDSADSNACFSIEGERPMWDLKRVGDMRYRAVCKKGFKVFDLGERRVVDEFRHPSLDEVTAVCDMPDGGFVASVNPQSGPDKGKVVLLRRFSSGRELVATYRCVSFFYAQTHEMPDGHVYMAHWTGHGAEDSKKGWQVVEFDREGNAVWHLHDPARFGSISGIDVLPCTGD